MSAPAGLVRFCALDAQEGKVPDDLARVLKAVMLRNKDYVNFQKNVCDQPLNQEIKVQYALLIKHPRCTHDIFSRLNSRKYKTKRLGPYHHVGEFIRDMRLIHDNCIYFNSKLPFYVNLANSFWDDFVSVLEPIMKNYNCQCTMPRDPTNFLMSTYPPNEETDTATYSSRSQSSMRRSSLDSANDTSHTTGADSESMHVIDVNDSNTSLSTASQSIGRRQNRPVARRSTKNSTSEVETGTISTLGSSVDSSVLALGGVLRNAKESSASGEFGNAALQKGSNNAKSALNIDQSSSVNGEMSRKIGPNGKLSIEVPNSEVMGEARRNDENDIEEIPDLAGNNGGADLFSPSNLDPMNNVRNALEALHERFLRIIDDFNKLPPDFQTDIIKKLFLEHSKVYREKNASTGSSGRQNASDKQSLNSASLRSAHDSSAHKTAEGEFDETYELEMTDPGVIDTLEKLVYSK